MALIDSFVPRSTEHQSVHRPVECGWRFFTVEGETVLQLDTYGTDEREFRGKVSQSIQVDRAGARALVAIIDQAFPNL
jgi:hypothetical protein